MDLEVAVIAGLFGIAGGVLGGILTFIGQRRLFDREDRYRFNSDKRVVYRDLYVAAHDWAAAVERQYEGLVLDKAGDPTARVVDAGRLPETLRHKAYEARLMGDAGVDRTVKELLSWLETMDKLDLGNRGQKAVMTPDEAAAAGPVGDPAKTTVNGYRYREDDFFKAAKLDLGTAAQDG